MDIKRLTDLRACQEARDWAAAQPDPKTAWETCPRADWMMWLACRLDLNAARPLRRRKTYELPLSEVAAMVVRRIVNAEIFAKRLARAAKRKRS